MKSKLFLLLSCFVFFFPIAVSAGPNQEIGPEIYIDQHSNRAMVPIRAFSEACGAAVTWNPAERKVVIELSGRQIEFFIGQKWALINNQKKSLDTEIAVLQNTTYVPIRFAGEALGAEVAWQPESESILIQNKNKSITFHLSQGVKDPNSYLNERFRNVNIEKNQNIYTVTGEAKVFEGDLSYVVEDGHNELAQGNVQTDQGAPNWGHFRIVIDVSKKDENTALMLILFQTSPNDGRRQFEFPLRLS